MTAATVEIRLVSDQPIESTISFVTFSLFPVTTDSQTSEEDSLPPPLPVKHHRDSEVSNHLVEEESQYSVVSAKRGSKEGYQFSDRPLPATPSNTVFNSNYEYVEIKNREVISTMETKTGKKSPPTPPPKPARHSRGSFTPWFWQYLLTIQFLSNNKMYECTNQNAILLIFPKWTCKKIKIYGRKLAIKSSYVGSN